MKSSTKPPLLSLRRSGCHGSSRTQGPQCGRTKVRPYVRKDPASSTPEGPDIVSSVRTRHRQFPYDPTVRVPLEKVYVTPLVLSQTISAARGSGAGSCGHQPDLLAARSADLPVRHRSLRDAIPALYDRAVLPRRQHAAAGGRGRRVRLARGEELPGLLHQRHHAAAGRRDLRRRHPPFAGAAVSGVRGPAKRRDARHPAEGEK